MGVEDSKMMASTIKVTAVTIMRVFQMALVSLVIGYGGSGLAREPGEQAFHCHFAFVDIRGHLRIGWSFLKYCCT